MSKYVIYQGKEDDMQQTVAKLLDTLGVLWFHPPNGGKRDKGTAIKLKRQGVKAGVVDCIILEPRGGYHGLFIELKTKNNKPTTNQKNFMYQADRRGYKCTWTNSIDRFLEIVEDYLKMRK